MMYPIKHKTILATALMFAMLLFIPDEEAIAGCKHSGGSYGSSKFGSQVGQGSVTICESAVAVTPARKAVVVKKPAAPKLSAAAAKLARVTAQKSVSNQAKAKVVVTKIVTKKVVVKTAPKPVKKVIKIAATTKTNASQSNFSPNRVFANVYPASVLSVGENAKFSSNASVHFRAGLVLNQVTEIRFTPVAYEWVFSDGTTLSGATINRTFASAENYSAVLRVTYAVDYRARGQSSWMSEPDPITLEDDIQLMVSGAGDWSIAEIDETTNESSSPGILRLVGQPCSTNTTFGCG